MPIWIVELARWLGVTQDSKRPNVGALLVLGGALLVAMGYSPDEVGGFGERVIAMATKLGEFVLKPDNALGVALGGLGYTMIRGRNGTDLRPEEVEAIRAELAAVRVRRALGTQTAPTLETDEGRK